MNDNKWMIMKAIYLKYGLFCLALITSCIQEKKQNPNVKIISYQSPASECLLDVEYFRLQVPSSIVIGHIDQFEYTDRYLFILQNDSKYKGLYAFNLDGTFHTKIGNFGRGNGEYIIPLSFTVGKREITILDGGKNLALYYDAETFEYAGKDKIFNTSYFEWIDEQTILCNNDEYEQSQPFFDKQYVLTDNHFIPKTGYVDKIICSGYQTGPDRPIYKINNGVRAYMQHCPYVYELSGTTVNPVYEIVFGPFNLPSETFMKQISKNGRDYYYDLINSGYISYYKAFETTNDFLVYFIVNHVKYIGLYSKKNDTAHLCKLEDFQNNNNIPPITVSGVFNDYFIAPLFVSEIKEQEDIKVSRTLLETINCSDDSDIILFKFKLQ